MRKLLITGRNGFIGTHLNKFLSTKSFDIINSVKTDEINLCDWKEVKALNKAETIIHLASKNFIPESFEIPLEYYNNNIISTLNILEKAKTDCANVVFFSTYVYGTPKYLPIDEDHVKNPLNPYTQSKLICEELCKAYSRDFGIPVTIFRPFNIFKFNSLFFLRWFFIIVLNFNYFKKTILLKFSFKNPQCLLNIIIFYFYFNNNLQNV